MVWQIVDDICHIHQEIYQHRIMGGIQNLLRQSKDISQAQ